MNNHPSGGTSDFTSGTDSTMQVDRGADPVAGNDESISSEYDVEIDENTIQALAIFQELWHPSAYKVNTAKREGFSVFAMFKCSSPGGKNILKKIFSRPTRDQNILEQRLNVVEYLCNPARSEFLLLLKANMKNMKSLQPMLDRMSVAQAYPRDWTSLYNTLIASCEIRTLLVNDLTNGSENGIGESLLKITELISPEIIEVATEIESIIDLKETVQTESFQAKPGYNIDLDNARSLRDNQSEYLNEGLNMELVKLQNYGLTIACAVVFFPQLGYLLQVPLSFSFNIDSLPNMQRRFTTNEDAYFKTEITSEMDERLGDPVSLITDIQTDIMHQLQDKVLAISSSLMNLTTFCAELDCYIAMAETSLQQNFKKPSFNSEGKIGIIGGRHPLQELVTEKFVANNYESGPDKKIKVITGPNSSGKSVYIKQVCIIVYLAHVGCFVPAEQASLPLVDKIFTRIKSPETLSSKQSAFMNDLVQVKRALSEATADSLVAIDEFGKGTQPKSGIVLLAATIKHFMKENTPHMLVTTHFHSLASLLPNNPQIQYMTFEINRQLETDSTVSDYESQFKIVEGQASSSFAMVVARRANIPDSVIRRAEELTTKLDKRLPITPFHSIGYDEAMKQNIEIAKTFLRLSLDNDFEVNNFLQRI
ncbi:MutS -like protein 5 [Halotydeus destructor]|nr:MutS -like protein 5 [Halotydeus destructor]